MAKSSILVKPDYPRWLDAQEGALQRLCPIHSALSNMENEMQLFLNDTQADALAEMLTSFLENEFDKMREGVSYTIAETAVADDLEQMVDDLNSGKRQFDLSEEMARLILEVHEASVDSHEGAERDALHAVAVQLRAPGFRSANIHRL